MAHARQLAKPRVITCSSKVGANATRAHPDGNHTGWQPGDLIPRPRRAAVRRLGLLFVHLFRPSHVTRAARCAHRPEKSLRILEKSMSAWRAGSWPAATNGCHGARTGAKEASAVSGSREGGGRGAHGRRALAAEEEMAESRQSTYRASEGALAMPAYRCFGIRLATVVEDLSPEGARQTSSL